MKKLISLISLGCICSFGLAFGQNAPTGPDGGPGTRPARPPLPRPILNNPDFQDFVQDFQAFRADFKAKMKDFRIQLANASETDKAAIRAETRAWLRNYKARQLALRKELRQHVNRVRAQGALDSAAP